MPAKSISTMVHLSVPVWISIVLTVTGWLLNLVSFTAPYWNSLEKVNWGLWQQCAEQTGCEAVSSEFLSDLVRVGRVFIAISFVAYTCKIVLVVLYLFWRSNLNFLTAAAWTSFFTVVGLFLGAMLVISSSNTSLSWCYYLCYTSGFLIAASGGVILHVRRQERLRLIELQEQQMEL